jgi:hypothetical protein
VLSDSGQQHKKDQKVLNSSQCPPLKSYCNAGSHGAAAARVSNTATANCSHDGGGTCSAKMPVIVTRWCPIVGELGSHISRLT